MLSFANEAKILCTQNLRRPRSATSHEEVVEVVFSSYYYTEHHKYKIADQLLNLLGQLFDVQGLRMFEAG